MLSSHTTLPQLTNLHILIVNMQSVTNKPEIMSSS